MPIKPGDNKLGKRDTVTLAAYREQIDPEGKGVAWIRPGWSDRVFVLCCACGDEPLRYETREVAVKPAWSEADIRYVCNTCCRRAWEVHKEVQNAP